VVTETRKDRAELDLHEMTTELRVPSDTPLTGELVARVVEVCRVVEEHGEGVVLAHLAGPGPAVRWPGPVEVALVNRWERALRRLERVPVPIVAVVDGACAGAALEVLLTADERIAVPGATFELTSEAWPGMVLYRLGAQLGPQRARRLAGGARLPADEAAGWGLVDVVGDDPGLVEAALTRLSGFDGAEFAVRRRLILDAPTMSYEDAVGAHLAACDRTLRRTPELTAALGSP
jgi:isomerase DpgB